MAKDAEGLLTDLQRALGNTVQSVRAMDAYYEGMQPLSYMAPELLAELEGRLRQVVINWPRLVVDSLEERLDVEGFRYGKDADADDTLWEIWQANNLDESSGQAHLEALISGRSYVIVGSGETDLDPPVISVESPEQVIALWDPQTRKVTAALKTWSEDNEPVQPGSFSYSTERYSTLYLPDVTIRYGPATNTGITEMSRDEHGLGVVPVVPVVNRGRLMRPWGVSELTDIIPLSDAACKIATDMMIAAEFHAMPRRWATGMGPEDFQDEQGNPLSTWSAIAGRLWATDNAEAKLGQFLEASLNNFHQTINALAAIVASLSGLPPHAVGLITTNPASADAIRSAEARLVKRAERRQRAFGGSWEDVMRLALRVIGQDIGPDARSLETLWADASTPTVAQQADAAVKLVTAGIIPIEQGQEDLGYTAVQRERMAQMRAEAQARGDIALAGIFGAQVPAPASAPTPPEPAPGEPAAAEGA